MSLRDRATEVRSENLGTPEAPIYAARVLKGEYYSAQVKGRGMGISGGRADCDGFEVKCGDSVCFLTDKLLWGLKKEKLVKVVRGANSKKR